MPPPPSSSMGRVSIIPPRACCCSKRSRRARCAPRSARRALPAAGSPAPAFPSSAPKRGVEAGSRPPPPSPKTSAASASPTGARQSGQRYTPRLFPGSNPPRARDWPGRGGRASWASHHLSQAWRQARWKQWPHEPRRTQLVAARATGPGSGARGSRHTEQGPRGKLAEPRRSWSWSHSTSSCGAPSPASSSARSPSFRPTHAARPSPRPPKGGSSRDWAGAAG